MNTQPTPETDANLAGWIYYDIHYCHDSLSDDPLPWPDFARKLERERDELKRWTSVNGVIDLQRERDEAREACDTCDAYLLANEQLRIDLGKIKRQWDETRKERDRLAAVLQQCREDSVELVTERDRINAIIASVEARQK